MTIDWITASSVVADQCACLVLAPPCRPVQPVADGADSVGDQFREEGADLVYCQGDHSYCLLWTVGSFARGDGGEDGVGEHGQGGVPVPGVPFADLVLIEADLALS